jgi:hypothetical protein
MQDPLYRYEMRCPHCGAELTDAGYVPERGSVYESECQHLGGVGVTAPELLAEYMTTHEITAEVTEPAAGLPEIVADAEGWRHYPYRARVDIAGELLVDGWRFGEGVANDRRPEPADVFGMLLSDVRSVLPYDGIPEAEAWEQWVDESGGLQPEVLAPVLESRGGHGLLAHFAERRAAYHECAAYLSLLREQLGDEVVGDLVAIAGQF